VVTVVLSPRLLNEEGQQTAGGEDGSEDAEPVHVRATRAVGTPSESMGVRLL